MRIINIHKEPHNYQKINNHSHISSVVLITKAIKSKNQSKSEARWGLRGGETKIQKFQKSKQINCVSILNLF